MTDINQNVDRGERKVFFSSSKTVLEVDDCHQMLNTATTAGCMGTYMLQQNCEYGT